jgi:two-component sensor histidine kinase
MFRVHWRWAADTFHAITKAPPPNHVTNEGPEFALAAEATEPVAMVLHELATNTAKSAAAIEQRVCIRQRVDAAVEHLQKFLRRPTTLPRTLCNRGNAREHVFTR